MLGATDQRKMERFSYSVILIMAFSRALELGLVAGLGGLELACLSQGELAFRDDGLWSQEESAIRHQPSQFVASMGIQKSKTYPP